MTTIDNEIKQKSSKIYQCINCDYTTGRKSNYDKHILSTKHSKNNVLTTINNQNKQLFSKKYICQNCEKKFNDRAGLWRHSKKCNIEDAHDPEGNENIYHCINDKELILMLIKQNAELVKETSDFKNIMIKVIENGTNNNSHNTTNSHNKAFNLNLFLNETCKDAMNIMDFVESIKLQVSDLESVGELGYVEGISNIIVKNLNALDVTQRPVHCTDKKRETIYIKDDNKWEKDEEQKKMHKMIKKVADKNARLLPKFTEKYPDYKNYHSKTSDKYSKIIIEAMGGSGDNDYEKEEKIIKNIAKNILVEKGS
jgi:hypothetical protein